ncbi:hypothetical protein NLJ89_g7163 [Agrocybe chaxingu]|uniref:ATP-dependent DNA helicase n=1 Tax=Agrocybe chaxingu TaxID=84603 RepID=A0A9W8MVQ0_9AGAR|nr:hypothetical protein NLJ89_g7163 [Agrocybe chaxingu]
MNALSEIKSMLENGLAPYAQTARDLWNLPHTNGISVNGCADFALWRITNDKLINELVSSFAYLLINPRDALCVKHSTQYLSTSLNIQTLSNVVAAVELPSGSSTDLYRTCQTCRAKGMERISRKRAQAAAQGMHWCTFGAHQVTIAECTAPDGTLHATCQQCLTRSRQRYAQTVREDHHSAENDFELAANDDAAEGVEAIPVDDFDAVFGDGSDLMDIDLPEDSAVSDRELQLLKNLDEKVAEITYQSCDFCLEDGFNLKVVDGKCLSCRNDKGDPVQKWSAQNNIQPALNVPPCLQGLTDMEDMLIARVKSYMQVRWTRGRQLAYQDHIVNFRQDTSAIATKLPRLPEDTDIVIIRKEDVDLSRHVDFTVRRDKVVAALQYKIDHDPHYADLVIDEEAVAQLPENGSVAHRLPTCREGRQNETETSMPAGPDSAAGDQGVEEGINEQVVGGVIDLGTHQRAEVDHLREAANNVVRGARYEHTIINAPDMDHAPLSEATPGYMIMAFPTLFPDGKDIQTLLAEGDQQLVSKMVRYGANLWGTRAFWLSRRHELLDMIRVKNSPHLFFTLSAADLQWPDLHKHMPNSDVDANGDLNPRAARQRRRTALTQNPHIAAAYLDQRLQVYFKHFLTPLLGIKDFWYRYEWQERGSGHIHGFLWMKDAPKVDEINFDLLKHPGCVIPPDQEEKMRQFTAFWDRIISTWNPFPHHDENQPLLGENPCSKDRASAQYTKQELADLLNWVERHTKCMPGYCQVKRKVTGQSEPQTFCRFDYPMALRHEAGIGLDSKFRVRFEPRRNDRLLNTHNVAMILGWKANVDVKPVLSKDAAINYIAKYASKSEKQAPAFPELLSKVTTAMDGSATAQSACQKMLNKMLGERTYSAQETAHLLLGIPLVRASASFQTLYIGPEGGMRELGEEDINENALEGAGAEGERRVTSDSWIQRYMKRAAELESLSLHEICSKYIWKKGEWKKRRESTKVIVRTYPRFSPNPEDPRYDDYCRTKVILHHPFRSVDTFVSEDQSWIEVYAQCRAAGHVHMADTLRCWEDENREVDKEEEDEEIMNPDVAEMDEADWQAWARLHPNQDIPLYGADDLGRRPIDDGWDLEASRQQWNNVEAMATWIDEKKREGHQQDNAQQIDINTLENEQRVIYDEYVNAYREILAGNDCPQQLFNIDGTAGCGKTYLIGAICQELRCLARENDRPNPVRVLAPSGVAALNIHGQTIHSALSLPITGFSPLTGSRLASMQVLWNGVHFVIIDEKSMLGLRSLAQIDSRCRQIFPQHANIPFGNLNVALVGDFAQLPPVGDTPLFGEPSSANSDNGTLSRDGSTLYRKFTTSFRLRIVHRQGGESPEQVRFRDLLTHASRGGLSVDEWKLLTTRLDKNLDAATRSLFDDAPCLYATRNDVHELNLSELQALNQPCARIMAKHDGGPDAIKAAADEAGGLEPHKD